MRRVEIQSIQHLIGCDMFVTGMRRGVTCVYRLK